MLDRSIVERLVRIVGPSHVSVDAEMRRTYGEDGTRVSHPADAVVFPGTTAEVAAIARLATETRTPMVGRGAGTGYSGGAVPIEGGLVISFERMNRILEIDESSLLAVVQPGVITGDLQDAVARVGLFYPPDPASLKQCTIGGNVAENAGGPRAVKYGVTRDYVLGLEAVLPSGDVIRTGGRTVKNVVGYDLTQLIVGSEGTLALVTEIILRLVAMPAARATMRASFGSVRDAARTVSALIGDSVVPATIELIDGPTLEIVARARGDARLAPPGVGAMLIIELDGTPDSVISEASFVTDACRAAGATEVRQAQSDAERDELWEVRRELSPALKVTGQLKLNNDVVVPRGKVSECFELIEELKRRFDVPIPSFGHAGDGNIHVNVMASPDDRSEVARAHAAVDELLRGVVALGGSISGEHGIGLSKAGFIALELSPETLAVMRQIKRAFDPLGILNPGKMFPEFARASADLASASSVR